jgi:hypothetical protein
VLLRTLSESVETEKTTEILEYGPHHVSLP